MVMPVKYTFVGDSGSSLSAVLTTSTGDPIDLTDADSVDLKIQSYAGASLGGPANIVDAPTGKVRYDFESADLETPGDYEAVFVVEFPEGTVTYPSSGPPFIIRVQAFNDDTVLAVPIVTISEAFTFTGNRVTLEDLFKAQMYTSIYLDLDVTDDTVMNYVLDSDLRKIRQGISCWAVDLHNKNKSNSTVVTLDVPEGIKSLSQGDVSITFDQNSSFVPAFAPPPIVQTIFSRLSWRTKTIKPKSMFKTRSTSPIIQYAQPQLPGMKQTWRVWD